MAKANANDFGTVNFDPMDYDNNVYDLYTVAICDPETEQVTEEEHYANEDEYRSALHNTYGREVMDEQLEDGNCDVEYDGCTYECPATYHIAYVVDHDED